MNTKLKNRSLRGSTRRSDLHTNLPMNTRLKKTFLRTKFWLAGHQLTLDEIFRDPPSSKITWGRIKKMLDVFKVQVIPAPADGMRLRPIDRSKEVTEEVKVCLEPNMIPNTGTIIKVRHFLLSIGIDPERPEDAL